MIGLYIQRCQHTTAKPIAGHSLIQLLPGGFANVLESVQYVMSVSVGGDDHGATTH